MITIDATRGPLSQEGSLIFLLVQLTNEMRRTKQLSHQVRIRVADDHEVDLQITFKKGTSRRNSAALDDEHSPRAGS